MKIDNLKLSISSLHRIMLVALMGTVSVAYGEIQEKQTVSGIDKAIHVLRCCLLEFKGDHKDRPFHKYIDDIVALIQSHREEFKTEISDIKLSDSSFTNKDQFIDTFVSDLLKVKNSKEWKAIRDTLAKYAKAVPSLKRAVADINDVQLLWAIKKRIQF